MKKLLLLLTTLVLVVTLSACSEICIGTECITGENDTSDTTDPADCTDDSDSETTTLDNMIFYDHINGHAEVTENQEAYILFEYEMRDFVKYQVAYLSCTCRNPDINYWQVAYVEINKTTNDIRTISYGEVFDVSTGHDYTPGVWADSSPTPSGMYLEDFETMFIPWLIGKDSTYFDGISIFYNGTYKDIITNSKPIDDAIYYDEETDTNVDLIDAFTSSSVSTNNMIRVMKSLITYHEENN